MIAWKLKDYLERHQITPYRLAKESKLSFNTTYNALSDDLRAIRFETLNAILSALQKITKQPISISDLLEYELLDQESQDWQDADLSRLGEYEPFDWGDENPATLGQPIIYDPQKGFQIDNG